MFNDEESTIKSLPILLNVIEDNKKKSRLSAENTTVQISLATIYDLITYWEQKGEQKMELMKQKVKAVLR